ncbi:YeaC family protein [Enterovibrio sp. 27052020O]|uniref:YeaC family protein n=1 Tax=Enterovibrio sp. 27052020O TaxID=3241166 RepID=UPI00388E24AE
MDIEQLLSSITPEAYERLSYAVETGKWPEGTPLSQEQRDHAMQVVMLYQSRHNTEPQHMTVAAGGEITMKSKSAMKRDFAKNQETIVQKSVNDD